MNTATQKRIQQEILAIIKEKCAFEYSSVAKEEVLLETDIKKELGMDSIAILILQITIEDRFQMRFNPLKDDLGQVFTTAERLGNYVWECIKDEKYEGE